MDKRLRFTTIFPYTTNIHLLKDVGQIPLSLQKDYDIETTLVTYYCTENLYMKHGLEELVNIIDKYHYLDNEASGLNIKFIEDTGKWKIYEKAIIKYLFKYSRKIDILNLYHRTQESLFYGSIYKFLNPKGKLYLKADINQTKLPIVIKDYESFNYPNSFMDILRAFRYLFNNKVLRSTKAYKKYCHDNIDILSLETLSAIKQLSAVTSLKNKLVHVPNGIALNNSCPVPTNKYIDKENIIITVGNLGTEAKNTYLLLDALTRVKFRNWKFYFIGSITHNLKDYLVLYFENNPNLKKVIFFKGKINNRNELYKYYNKSKIFCLPSKWEGYPISIVEALYYKNYIIASSSVSSIHDICPNKNQFSSVDPNSVTEIADNIQFIIDNDLVIRQNFLKNYNLKLKWKECLEKLIKTFED